MTNPESGRPRLAAFLSDAGFARRVLTELLARDCYPSLILLPEFAPARTSSDIDLAQSPARSFLDLIGDLPVFYAAGADDRALESRLRQAEIDYLLVACWPRLLGPRTRTAPTQAALNLHPSCLPRYRGADPIGAQLAANESRLGVSLHLLDARFDHGDIVARQEFELPQEARNRSGVEREAAGRGVELLIAALHSGPAGWQLRIQDQAFDTD